VRKQGEVEGARGAFHLLVSEKSGAAAGKKRFPQKEHLGRKENGDARVAARSATVVEIGGQ